MPTIHAQVEPNLVDPDVTDKIGKTDPALADVYQVLSRRHHSGTRDQAERHNEHQP